MKKENLSRRVFLHRVGAGTLALAAGSPARTTKTDTSPKQITRLTEHLIVYQSHINVGIIRASDKALLIDCGDGSVTDVLGDLGIKSIDQIIFTHHHRDQACGAHNLSTNGARIGVPATERDYFDKVSAYWNDPRYRWHLYNLRPHHLMLAEPVRVLLGGQYHAGVAVEASYPVPVCR